jgi:ribosomal protein S18 acetylase RimI-like enzyme
MVSGNTDRAVLAGKPPAQIYDGRIRAARPADRTWLIPLSGRLHEFGRQTWRTADSIDRAVARSLERVLCEPSANAEIQVAEDAGREPLGFVSLQTATDFTGEIHSYISDLVVRSTAEGRGVGAALLREAESWAVRRRHRLLALNVFTGNHRARELYERVGFLSDTVRMVKELRSPGTL